MALGGYLFIYVDVGKGGNLKSVIFHAVFVLKSVIVRGRNIVEFAAKVNRLFGGS